MWVGDNKLYIYCSIIEYLDLEKCKDCALTYPGEQRWHTTSEKIQDSESTDMKIVFHHLPHNFY